MAGIARYRWDHDLAQERRRAPREERAENHVGCWREAAHVPEQSGSAAVPRPGADAKGRVYAISLSDNVKKIHQKIFGTHYPDGSEVRDRCGASVRASVRASVGDSVWAYNGTFFVLPRESWKYTENIKTEEYPFQCLATLWERGLVPSFDGKKWRLHGGKDAEILYEWTP